MAPWLTSRFVNMDPGLLVRAHLVAKQNQAHFKTIQDQNPQLIRYNYTGERGVGLASAGCFLFVNCRRTWAEFSAQDAVSPVSTPQTPPPSLSVDFLTTQRLCPHSSWNTIPPLWKRDAFPIPSFRKSLRPRHLLLLWPITMKAISLSYCEREKTRPSLE